MQRKEQSYLFVMERMDRDRTCFSQLPRRLNLSRREQEMVRLIVGGLGNKEITFALGSSSLNTVKGYMKLLVGRLGVRNRVGIIPFLLTQNAGSLDPIPLLSQSPNLTLYPSKFL
jgi:DNA-binding NarL/FixJ family response regulator